MSTNPIRHRFKSGDMCFVTGWYEFDGYVDGEPLQSDTDHPGRIFRSAGEVFPLCQRASRPCFWKMASKSADSPPPDAPSAQGVAGDGTLDAKSYLTYRAGQPTSRPRRLRRAQ